MMFGEQHLVRFGSMSKPVGSDPPVTLQDSELDPPEVTTMTARPPNSPGPLSHAATVLSCA